MPNITIEPAPRGVDSVAARLIVGYRAVDAPTVG